MFRDASDFSDASHENPQKQQQTETDALKLYLSMSMSTPSNGPFRRLTKAVASGSRLVWVAFIGLLLVSIPSPSTI